MGRMVKTVAISELKTHSLKLLDEVAQRRREILVTKRGKPIARVVPLDALPPEDPLERLRERCSAATVWRISTAARSGVGAEVSALVLDTHAWVWWVSKPDKLSRRQRTAVDRARTRAGDSLLLSIISGWEVALLVQAGRLRLPVPLEAWLGQAMSVPGLEVVPLTVPIIATAARLAVLRDPADVLIVATAQHHGARLVTSDARIEETKAVEVVG